MNRADPPGAAWLFLLGVPVMSGCMIWLGVTSNRDGRLTLHEALPLLVGIAVVCVCGALDVRAAMRWRKWVDSKGKQ